MRRMLARKGRFLLDLLSGAGLFLLIDEAVDAHALIPVVALAGLEH